MADARKPWEHAKSGGAEHDALAARFVESLSYDTRLYKHDIAGSVAHARMLNHVGLIDDAELQAIERGLTEIEAEIVAAGVTGWKGWRVELEDVHMCIEAALIDRIGDPGRKLHTGRSRNDQVALDLKLWLNDALVELNAAFDELFRAFTALAERDGDIVMPSYTHMQRAQPIAVGGELIGWLTALDRCLSRLMTLSVVNSGNPLGSGAIAGSSLPLDRAHVAEQLNIGEPTPSSIDATASRDAAIDFVYGLAMTAMTLSRLAEQWILYMSAEFRFITLGDAYTTGSSMMPQKRNPDMLELIRGRCGTVYGHLVALLTICKGLPIGYNRDLQEDKRHVFAAYDMTLDCLRMASGIVRSARFERDRIGRDIDAGFADATALAEYLVTRGTPFRTAHQQVAALVRMCEQRGVARLADLSLDDMRSVSDRIDADVTPRLGAANVAKRYQTAGNAGLSGYRHELERWKQRLTAMTTGSASSRAGDGENADTANLFGESTDVTDADQVLIDAYVHQGRTLDDLPYTPQFEAIFEEAGAGRDRRAVLARLLNLRKAGKLPRIGRAKEPPPNVDEPHQRLLGELVAAAVGALSQRDQLPYTAQFDDLVTSFNDRAGVQLSPYQVWRIVAKLAK